jgi:uncharacterized protein (TIGR02246 family)
MSSRPYSLLLVIILLVAFACAPAADRPEPAVEDTSTTEEDVKAIRDWFDRYVSTIEAGDLDGYIALFSDDTISMPPNAPAPKGQQAYRRFVQPFFEKFNVKEPVSLEEIEVSANWAFARGTYTFQATPKTGGDSLGHQGKFLYLFGRQGDGSWKCTHFIWNSDEPPAGSGT